MLSEQLIRSLQEKLGCAKWGLRLFATHYSLTFASSRLHDFTTWCQMPETDIRQFNINFGPQHPAAHGVLAPRARAGRRGGGARRPAHRPLAPRHREADRAQDLPAGHRLLRPPRLRGADEPGARLLPRGGKAAGHGGAQARPAHPRALFRDRPAAVAPPQRDDAGDGRRRAHPAAVGLRRAREADGVLRARLGHRACTPSISAWAACTPTCRRS